MTRKHYIALAAALRGITRGITICGAPQTCSDAFEYMRGAQEQASNDANSIADVLQRENPRFDRARFLAACGVQS